MNLRKLLEGAFAQINPFDQGKTFATVQRSIKPPPAKTIKQQPTQNVVQSINRATGFNPSRQIVPSRPAPSFKPKIEFNPSFANWKLPVVNATPVDLLRGVARVPETAVRSLLEAGTNQALKQRGLPQEASGSSQEVKDPIRRFLYGKEPVQTYQKQAADIGEAIKPFEERGIIPKGSGSAVAFAGAPVLGLLDVGTGGRGKTVTQLVKANSKEAVEQISKKAALNFTRDQTERIAKTQSKQEILDIIRQSQKPRAQTPVKTPVFEGYSDLSTKTLETGLKGKSVVSKQYVMDLTNQGGIKQAERDLIRQVIDETPGDKIDVNQFASKVKSKLLPLERGSTVRTSDMTPGQDRYITNRVPRYENISLSGEKRGPISNYSEHVYGSPVKTSAGEVHFAGGQNGREVENYFAHTRVEDVSPPQGPMNKNVDSIMSRLHRREITMDQADDLLRKNRETQGDTRRVIEIQSDLFQKGRLENELLSERFAKLSRDKRYLDRQDIELILGKDMAEKRSLAWHTIGEQHKIGEIDDAARDVLRIDQSYNKRLSELKELDKEKLRLQPYKNTWHERVIKEEMARAAKDGKTKLQFPTGKTAMEIEGLGGGGTRWFTKPVPEPLENLNIANTDHLKPGNSIYDRNNVEWIVTSSEGEGSFLAIPKYRLDEEVERLIQTPSILKEIESDIGIKLNPSNPIEFMKKEIEWSQKEGASLPWLMDVVERFSLEETVDTSNPIFKFYEKEVGKYLQNKFGAKRITDAQGVEWWEVSTVGFKNKPVEAFGGIAGFEEDEEGNIRFNPQKAALGMAGTIGGFRARDFGKAKLKGKTFKGVDKKLRFEIDDSKAKLIPFKPGVTDKKAVPLDKILDHPDIYRQYGDQIKKIPVVVDDKMKASGKFNGTAIKINPSLIKNQAELRNTLLHEVTHAVQEIEGFARGGSPSGLYQEAIDKARTQLQKANEKYRSLIGPDGSRPMLRVGMKRSDMNPGELATDDLMKAHDKLDSLLYKRGPGNYNKSYNKLAGEVEARTVEKRSDMTPAQRDVRPFDQDYDIPVDKQTVRMRGGQVQEKTRPSTIDEFANAPKPKKRGFIETVEKSPNTSPKVAKNVSGEYDVLTNKAAIKKADETIAKDFEGAINRAKTSERYTTENQAISLRLIDELQAVGRHQDAIDIVEKTAERATNAGQATQILAAYNRLEPEGVLLAAQREITKAKNLNPRKYANLSLSPEQAKTIRTMAENIQKMPEGDEKILATRQMLEEIERVVPTPGARKITTMWKAGLLTGLKGAVGGNIVGNTTKALLTKLSDVPAAGLDTAISKIFGRERSKALTTRGMAQGFVDGLKVGAKKFKTGVGAENLTQKLDYKKTYYNRNTKLGRAAQKYTDTVFNFYSAADRPFYHSALQNNLNELALVEAKNQGLKGQAARKFVKETVQSPPDEILTKAVANAEEAVFQNKNPIGSGLSGLKREVARKGGAAGEVASEVLLPFTGVPSAVATAVYKYTPAKSVVKLYDTFGRIRTGTFDKEAQRELVEAMGSGVAGTGLIWLGSELTKSGQMTLGWPTDRKERELWESEGKTPYSILIGGKWRSLNYTGPIMALLGMGGQIQESGSIASGVAGSGKSIIGSSPLQGVQGALDAITEPDRHAQRYIQNLAGSTIPTLVKDVAVSGDPAQREVNSITESIMARLPGLRNELLPKRGTFGQELPRATSTVGTLIDPFKSSKARTNPVITEMRRLQEAGTGIAPADVKKTSITGIELNPKQVNELQALSLPKIEKAWKTFMDDNRYKSLGDTDKQRILGNISEDVNAASEAAYLQKIGQDPSKALSNLTRKQEKILKSGIDIEDYFEAGETYAVNKEKEAIRSKYSREVRDFYNLSNKEKQAMFQENPTKAKELYDQAKKLEAELEPYSKKKPSSTKLASSRGGRRRSGKRARKFDYDLYDSKTLPSSIGALRKLIKSSQVKARKA